MPDPLVALLWALTAAVVLGLICWPRRGLVALLRRARWAGERAAMDDALKHIYDREYHAGVASIHSLAGALERSTSQAAILATRLEAIGLVRAEEAGLRLTPSGRRAALRIIRIHRLWETYLADQTGFAEAEWHPEADRREHRTTAAEVEHMERATGHPRFDPHGDPIPTAEGEVPPRRGEPLCVPPPGFVGTIVHVEDEPEAIYAQLRAKGIRIHMRVTVLEKSADRIQLEIDGDAITLAPVVAANVWVTALPNGVATQHVDRLSDLRTGESRRVLGISPACQGMQRRRLLDLGLVRGTEVTAVMNSPAGDPTGYRVRGAIIALRQAQANLVEVESTHEHQE